MEPFQFHSIKYLTLFLQIRIYTFTRVRFARAQSNGWNCIKNILIDLVKISARVYHMECISFHLITATQQLQWQRTGQ